MYEQERQDKILDILRNQKTMAVSQLADVIFCSSATLRRDLIKLEKSGHIRRAHGRVTLIKGNNEFSFPFRENIHHKEKEHIANLANDYLTTDMAIFLDSSSTTYALCQYLDKKLIVVTNSLKTATALNANENIELYMAGGLVKKHSSAVLGEKSIDFLKNFNADIAFISCRGVSERGLFEADFNQAIVKQAMIKNAKKTVLLLDHSKYDSEHVFLLTEWEEIDALVTDKAPDERYAKLFDRLNIDVVY